MVFPHGYNVNGTLRAAAGHSEAFKRLLSGAATTPASSA
jgi:hypothetical protein